MLLNQETKDKFGYSVESLSQGSSKKICLRCDYCQGVYESTYKQYNKAHNVIDKDACIKCKYQKRKDISLKLYGVENSAQRKEVREKISEKCAFKQEGFEEKKRETMLKRYGVVNAMDSEVLKQKQKQTVQDKYGVENVSQIPEAREKREQTNLQKFGHKQFLASEEGKQKKTDGMMAKYGVTNAFQSEEVKQKIRQTNLQNLGVEMPTQSKEVMAKIEQTNMERYGCKSPSQNDEVKQKIVDTNIQRYGCTNQMERPEVHRQIRISNIKKYGCEYATQSEEIKKQIRRTRIEKGLTKVFDGKDMITIANELDKPYSTLVSQVSKYGIEKARLMSKKMTSIELLLKEWLDKEQIKYIFQFRIGNKIADFLLSDYNIVIEVDGLFWHSDRCRPDSYHVDKHNLYIKHGYLPLFFRENEINNKFDIVKSIILNKMGRSNRIFARKCNIIKVDREVSQTFFEQNHLMGKGRGVTYGLTYNDELILCIIIRKVNGARYEISRFCPKRGYQVVGGLSRLITYFLRENSIDSLTTFIDRRYGSGEYLTKLGFKFINCSPSFVWTDSQETFHRLRFRSNSGYEHGLVKLWDCGQARYDLCVKS